MRLRPAVGFGKRTSLELAKMFLCQLHELLMRKTARRGDQNILRRVVTAIVTLHAIAVEAADGLPCTEDRPPQRMSLPEVAGEDLMDQVLGVIHIHLQLFEDDALFLFDVALL